ncbi:hypothetical protein D0T49_12735 [Paludibacter sp. 221]|uniref:hypothetical protein n=1 Tax=Paludibacter sp. 221 TaxID=2302939 RepID=UPI0013D0C7CE|nr:hypothetical protein [Paludibacter sp. 221]NDV47911.1 hypothetical protein [Paludibacter sp. 221]
MLNKERDINTIKEMLSSDYTSCIHNDYGVVGINNLKMTLEVISNIFKFINLRNFSSIIIFNSDSYKLSDKFSTYSTINNFAHLGSINSDNLVIQINSLDEIIATTSTVTISEITPTDFVYQYTPKREMFHTRTSICDLPKVPGTDSCFAVSTFKSLEEAMSHYKTSVVRFADCLHIKTALHSEERIFFKPHPEHLLRDSMVYFLKARLRGEGLEVRPEQAVDTSHPVDVKVTWGFTNHIALIEIKWLGKSLNNDTLTFTSNYTDSRARDGATQLAEYLDANAIQVPNHNTIGYLVVFDLRRKSTKIDTTQITQADGYWYEDKEITYNPQYHITRKDFAPPTRMFITPQCILNDN